MAQGALHQPAAPRQRTEIRRQSAAAVRHPPLTPDVPSPPPATSIGRHQRPPAFRFKAPPSQKDTDTKTSVAARRAGTKGGPVS